ncbi:hypothetical protein CPC08DRAFT_673352 [Agrocybe pediades]|nr:hypothetical protein CPC08DRAFT_673352 [Agrocybe pediades]
MPPTVHVIQNPTDAQIEEAVGVAMRAFAGDVSVDSMTGGNDTLQPALYRSMIKAGASEGGFWVVQNGDDDGSGNEDEEAESRAMKIRSFGIWFGPGKKLFETEEQRSLGWNDYFAGLSVETREWWMTTFHTKHEENLERLLGSAYQDDWFANLIATDPAHQRKGYASAMIRQVFREAEKQGKTVALATQTEINATFYQNLGFTLLGKEDIPAPTGTWPDYFLRWYSGSR